MSQTFNLSIKQILIKWLLTIFSAEFNKKTYLSVQLKYNTFQPYPDVRGVCKKKLYLYWRTLKTHHLLKC